MRVITIFVFCFSWIINLQGKNVSSFGSPYIHNYKKSQYKAGNQNWSIDQGNDGVMYLANNEGLLTFDGSYWELYPLNNREIVRSVAIGPDDNIYVGGKEEFGFFQKLNGTLKYHKLSQLVDSELLENDEIWKIHILGDSILFQAFSKVYIYYNHKIEIYYGEGEPFLFTHKLNDKLWMEKIPSGLYSWRNNRLQNLQIQPRSILTILPYAKNEYLIGTAKNGLYILHEDGNCTEWNIEVEAEILLKDSQLNNGIKIDDDTFAFGTIKNGIIIINREGKLIQHLHKKTVYRITRSLV